MIMVIQDPDSMKFLVLSEFANRVALVDKDTVTSSARYILEMMDVPHPDTGKSPKRVHEELGLSWIDELSKKSLKRKMLCAKTITQWAMDGMCFKNRESGFMYENYSDLESALLSDEKVRFDRNYDIPLEETESPVSIRPFYVIKRLTVKNSTYISELQENCDDVIYATRFKSEIETFKFINTYPDKSLFQEGFEIEEINEVTYQVTD